MERFSAPSLLLRYKLVLQDTHSSSSTKCTNVWLEIYSSIFFSGRKNCTKYLVILLFWYMYDVKGWIFCKKKHISIGVRPCSESDEYNTHSLVTPGDTAVTLQWLQMLSERYRYKCS